MISTGIWISVAIVGLYFIIATAAKDICDAIRERNGQCQHDWHNWDFSRDIAPPIIDHHRTCVLCGCRQMFIEARGGWVNKAAWVSKHLPEEGKGDP